MPRILRNLKINEISGVDKGAGRGVRIMLMKRDGDDDIDWNDAKRATISPQQALDALSASIRSIFADETVVNKAERMVESFDQFLDYVETDDMNADEIKKLIAEAVQAEAAKTEKHHDDDVDKAKMSDEHKRFHDSLDSEDEKKAFRAMSPAQRDGHMDKTKKAKHPPHHDSEGPDPGDSPKAPHSSNKREDEELVKRDARIADLEKALGSLLGEKRDAEFRKRAVDMGLKEEDGAVMMKAFDGDTDALIEFQKRTTETIKALRSQIKTSVVFGEFGKSGDQRSSALQEIEAKAAELRKTEPKLTQAQAFTKVYTDPANRELVEREKSEQANRLTRLAAETGR
jgi:hypothetical protein